MSSYVIEEILKTRKITDYLASKGIHPESETGGKIKYCCPLHSGDNDPSFMVFTSGEFENFYCFGCKKKYHIIHLYTELEKVSYKEAIKALSSGLDIDVDSEINHAIREIETDRSIWSEYTPVQLSLMIGRLLYDFIKRVEKDPDCLKSADLLFAAVDKATENGDLLGLKKIYDRLPDVLLMKVKEYDKIKEDRIRMAPDVLTSPRRSK